MKSEWRWWLKKVTRYYDRQRRTCMKQGRAYGGHRVLKGTHNGVLGYGCMFCGRFYENC
jgi:hypothetical protein